MKKLLQTMAVAIMLAVSTSLSAQSVLDVNKVYVIKTVVTSAVNVSYSPYTYTYAVGDTVYWTANYNTTYGAKTDGIYAVKQADFSVNNDASLWTVEYTSGVYRLRNKYNTANYASKPYIQTWANNVNDIY